MNHFQNSPSTDKHSPSITAPGKSHSETTSPSTGGAAPGVSFYSVLQSQKSVVAVLFAAFLTLIGFIYLMWSGKLDRWVDTWQSLFPTLILMIVVGGTVLGFFLRRLNEDVTVESAGGPEADSKPVEPVRDPVRGRIVKLSEPYATCECIQSLKGLVVVIHTGEGYIRFDAEPLIQGNAIWPTDRSRMARWIDQPQDKLTTNQN